MTVANLTTLGALLKAGGSIKTGPFGTTLKAAEYSNSGMPVISVGEVGHGRLRVRVSTPRVGPDVVRRLPEYVLRAGDIVFGRKGAVDRAARVHESEDGHFLGSDGIRVRLPAVVDPRYMIYELQSAEARSWIIQNAHGTTMASLNQEVLRRVPIRILPLAEQRAVGQVLDDVDTLISSIERLIAKKQAIKQGMMQQLLTGKTRLPGFTAPWRRRKLDELLVPRVERHTGDAPLEVLSCTKHQGFVRSLDYFKNQVFSRNLAGYRIICRGDIGYPANHVEEGSIGVQEAFATALVSPIYVVMRPLTGVDTYFLQRQLKLDEFRQEFARVTNASVNRRGSLRWPQFSQIEAPVPAEEEQRAISRVLRDSEAEVQAVERRLAKALAVKQGMMQALLTGRTRLPVEEIAAS